MQLICGEDIFDHLLPELFSELPVQEPPAEEPASGTETPPEEEGEDTTPPIKVNESQDLALLRKKVRRMMLRG